MTKLSVIIPTKNVAHLIKDCLESVAFADEVIVIDMASTDGTREICQNFPRVKFFSNVPDDGNFDKNRRLGFEKAQGPWLLKLDSDERLSQELQKELSNFLKTEELQKACGYYFKVKLYVFGKFITRGIPSKEIRLFKKGHFEFNPEKFHQQIKIKGRTGTFKNYYLHFNHRSIYEWLEKMNHYTENDLKAALGKGAKSPLWKMIFVPVYVFFLSYLIRLGFLEGFHGFLIAALLAYYSFIEKAKLWEARYKQRGKIDF